MPYQVGCTGLRVRFIPEILDTSNAIVYFGKMKITYSRMNNNKNQR